ncbi:hypothetical protein Efla_003431 [Eimeria flavescens]
METNNAGPLQQPGGPTPSTSSSRSSSAAIFGGDRASNSAARMGLYGALSSCVAAILLQPLDVIKTRQVSSSSSSKHSRSSSSSSSTQSSSSSSTQQQQQQQQQNGPWRAVDACAVLAGLMQQQQLRGARATVRAAAASVRAEYGLLGFWRGSLPLLLRVAPGTGFYFAALGPMMNTWGTVGPLLQSLPLQRIKDTPIQVDVSAAPSWYLGVVSGLARGLAVAVFNPISIVKTRMESSLKSGGMFEAFWTLLRREPALNWFKGTLATVCRDVPFSGLFFVVYVHLKTQLGVAAEARSSVSCYALQNFACGVAAAGTASALTHPFDVLRTRLQLDGLVKPAAAAAATPAAAAGAAIGGAGGAGRAGGGRAPGAAAAAGGGGFSTTNGYTPIRRGLVGGLVDLTRREGLGVMWRGLGVRVFKRSLMAALTWTSYEEIKSAVSSSSSSSSSPSSSPSPSSSASSISPPASSSS